MMTMMQLADNRMSLADATTQAPIEIDVDDVSIVFDTPKGQVVAADRVSFQIRRGEFVCLLGPSGCGKSTVLNTIAGFETPFEGSVRVARKPVTGPGPDRGMVFQQPHLFPWKSVRSNISHGPSMAGKSSKQAGAIADDLIAMVGLTRFADAYPHTLSGGMQQRVAIARALANRPAVLLMDEPFGALDAQTRAVMQESLLALWAQVGTTIVFVTHDIDEAIFLADRVLLMSAGPGRILRDLRIDLPRPRSSELVLSPAYAAYKKDCLDLIRAESLRAFDQQAVK
ncbi:ABC transporter related [Rhodopseudomonas palustris HaA2]|uniref:ABC transporter related n=2 Tax=Rhodopseudomonas palustris TaxID=1076 RepID=Q2J019_RHOP2|nr:ABC transporter related [Rhodopseudomonas palustris HaA2]